MSTSQFARAAASSVYPTLARHQVEEQWACRQTMAYLQAWAVRFDTQFKLRVPEITLCLNDLPAHVGGQFRYGHNGLGLRGEITINARYLVLPWWWLLSVLLHELLHGWQQAYGHPGRGNYHNREFRDKAAEFGLVVDERGHQKLLEGGRFFALLEEHGVALPEFGSEGNRAAEPRPAPLDEVNRRKPQGQSKLKKWSCDCTNVRCAVAEFYAQCLRCGQVFRLQSNDAERPEDTKPGS